MASTGQSVSYCAPHKISAGAIRNQLQRILTCPEFTATESQRKFLNFVVLETLAGNSDKIKGFTVATCALGRGGNFNQAVDPIVSIQANKLRWALERYYLVAGHDDPVCIDIPKGTYVPVFIQQSPHKSVAEALSSTDRASVVGEAWPTIFIRPFLNLTDNTALDWLGPGFASELRMEMTQHRDIKVLKGIPAGGGKRAADFIARFVIDGEILNDAEGILVIVTLTDNLSNLQLWSNRVNCGNDLSLLVAFQKKIVQTAAAQIGCEQGIIAKKILTESTDKTPEKLKTYEAILRFIEYVQAPTEEGFIQALNTLEHARRLEPLCGKIWSMLARLYIIIYAYEIPGLAVDGARQKAVSCAEKGAKLAPDNQFPQIQ